jgi:prephenate dehydrogenase
VECFCNRKKPSAHKKTLTLLIQKHKIMTIAIVGIGLIGGSMALKLRAQNFTQHIIGVDASPEHLATALKMGIIDEACSLADAMAKAQLVIVATPVDVATRLLADALDLAQQHSIIDVGSTKQKLVDALKNHPKRARYVATHPMWGTENSGPQSAMINAFQGKVAVLCDVEDSAPDALTIVRQMYQALEMQLVEMSAHDHDIHTAYISHISHISSYALANTVLEKEREENTIFQLASSGFSSTVRLAKSHPEMWVPIFKQNRDNVLDVLNEHISQLRKFKSALEKENFEYLEELIENANRIRPILAGK